MMSWSVSKIKDYEKNFPDRIDEDGKTSWNTATYCLTYASMSAGFNKITEKNYLEVYARIHMQEKLFGSYRQKTTEEGLEQFFYSIEEIKNHIGFETNASPKTTAQFTKQMWENVLRDTRRESKETK